MIGEEKTCDYIGGISEIINKYFILLMIKGSRLQFLIEANIQDTMITKDLSGKVLLRGCNRKSPYRISSLYDNMISALL